jgi:hypothetical protein
VGVGLEGLNVGDTLKVGEAEREGDGATVGLDVGWSFSDGTFLPGVGCPLGVIVGLIVGAIIGLIDGLFDGSTEGAPLGFSVGCRLG